MPSRPHLGCRRTLTTKDAALLVEATQAESGRALWGPYPAGPYSLKEARSALQGLGTRASGRLPDLAGDQPRQRAVAAAGTAGRLPPGTTPAPPLPYMDQRRPQPRHLARLPYLGPHLTNLVPHRLTSNCARTRSSGTASTGPRTRVPAAFTSRSSP